MSDNQLLQANHNFSVFVIGNITCRVCLRQDETEMLYLFSEQEFVLSHQKTNLLHMFLSCTALNVTFDDPYPKHICNGCFGELVEAYSFLNKCKQSIDQVDKINHSMISDDYSSNDCDDEISLMNNLEDMCKLDESRTANNVDNNSVDINSFNIITQELGERISTDSTKPRCHNCQISFSDRNEYKRHWQKIHSKYSLIERCKDIDVDRSSNINIVESITSAESNNLPRCRKCNISFTTRAKYKVHWAKLHSKYAHFLSAHSFKKSLQDGTKKLPACRKCNLYFPNKSEYKKHAKMHSTHLCPQCGYVCRSSSTLREHFTTHTNLRPYKCTICDKTYKSTSSLNVHKSTHLGIPKYECQHCNKKFITWSSRFSHIRIRHTVYDKHVCEICSKGFSDSNKLKVHIWQHTGETPYPCEQCDMAFKSKTELRSHMLKHTGIRNYPCPICDKRFLSGKHVKQHMVTHTGERRHKCEICKKGFTQAHVLRNHLKTHERQHSEPDIQLQID